MAIIYLSGPINGCSDDECSTWRDEVKARYGVENCIDPMRRDYRGREDESVNEIVTLDKADIGNAVVMLANCWQTSWGTAMEIHYAHSIGIPVIAVVPLFTRVSPWLRYHACIVRSLPEAYQIIEGTADGDVD